MTIANTFTKSTGLKCKLNSSISSTASSVKFSNWIIGSSVFALFLLKNVSFYILYNLVFCCFCFSLSDARWSIASVCKTVYAMFSFSSEIHGISRLPCETILLSRTWGISGSFSRTIIPEGLKGHFLFQTLLHWVSVSYHLTDIFLQHFEQYPGPRVLFNAYLVENSFTLSAASFEKRQTGMLKTLC